MNAIFRSLQLFHVLLEVKIRYNEETEYIL